MSTWALKRYGGLVNEIQTNNWDTESIVNCLHQATKEYLWQRDLVVLIHSKRFIIMDCSELGKDISEHLDFIKKVVKKFV